MDMLKLAVYDTFYSTMDVDFINAVKVVEKQYQLRISNLELYMSEAKP